MTSLAVGREPAPWRAGCTAVAQYESIALWTPLPSITRMVDVFPPLGLAILVVIAIHFYGPRRRHG